MSIMDKLSVPVATEKKIEKTITKTLTREDFETGFLYCRQGAEYFIDSTFKQALADVLKKEYKLEVKNWEPLLKLWRDYNSALHCLYRDKLLEILSLPEGEKLEVQVSMEVEEEVPVTKGKR